MGLLELALTSGIPPSRFHMISNPKRSYRCTGRSESLAAPLAEIHRQRLEVKAFKEPCGNGQGVVACATPTTVARSTLSTPQVSSSSGRSVASANNVSYKRRSSAGERRVWLWNGGEVLDRVLRERSNSTSLLGPRLMQHWPTSAIAAPVPSNSSRRWNGHEVSAFSGGIVKTAAHEFSGVSLCVVAWIPGSTQYGRGRGCVAVHAEMNHDSSKHPEHPLKQEVHGRRMRSGRPKPCGPYDIILLQIPKPKCSDCFKTFPKSRGPIAFVIACPCSWSSLSLRDFMVDVGSSVGKTKALLQGFNWESHKGLNGQTWWQVLKSQAEELCALGVTDIWLPPASQAVDRQGYLPGELYNLDASKYGTGVELKELIDAMHQHGISVLADIVINHRSGKLQDSKGHWNIFKGGNRDKRLDWGPWAVVDDDLYDSGGKGHHDTGESYAAAPDLDHTNKQVQDELTDWMNWMKAEIGYDGWRFDFVKGYAPEYTELYCSRTNPTIAVGELWTSMAYYEGQLSWDQNRHRQQLCDWIDGTHGASCAFDFTTKGILQRAVENEFWRLKDDQGKPPGLIGWWPEKAVTFLDNHDTGSTQRHWAFPDKKVLPGYAYILTHPGIPCIFYDHIYSFQLMGQIKELLDLRKRHRINAVSRVNIQKAEADIYVAKIDNRVILKLGSRYDMGTLLPGKDSWKMTLSGPDFAIWESTAPLPPLKTPPVQAEDVDLKPIQNSHPAQPVHITSKMSEATRKKIQKYIANFPELVGNRDAMEEKPTN